MSFWSAETLRKDLPGLITPFDPNCVDSSSYVLKLGDQVFVTQDDTKTPPKDRYQVNILNDNPPNHTVYIEPGQFAFLLTHEIVEVPRWAIAFISMKATVKFKGLINISGFHIDPTFKGKLTFSVYNAGPNIIALDKNQPLFQIFYADLDQATAENYTGKSYMNNKIDSTLTAGMTGQVFSPMLLQRKIIDLEKAQTQLERHMNTFKVAAVIMVAIIGLLLSYIQFKVG